MDIFLLSKKNYTHFNSLRSQFLTLISFNCLGFIFLYLLIPLVSISCVMLQMLKKQHRLDKNVSHESLYEKQEVNYDTM